MLIEMREEALLYIAKALDILDCGEATPAACYLQNAFDLLREEAVDARLETHCLAAMPQR